MAVPWYRKRGKIETPITESEFLAGMERGPFVQPEHKAFIALLYYTGVRKGELLRAMREQFRVTPDLIVFDVGKRLKRGITTPSLSIPRGIPYGDDVAEAITKTEAGDRVFPYSSKTGYNIVSRVFTYPHYFRLSRITNFLSQGYTIPQLRSWTGLTLTALNYYVGLVSIHEMGESFRKK